MNRPTTPAPAPACPVRGHTHLVTQVRTHVQDGTGDTATTWECPTGRYRWFQVDRLGFNPSLRMDRPRAGWKDNA